MSRTDRRAPAAALPAAAALVAALALGGCMRIYADPELPDIVLAWNAEFQCAADEHVVVSLTAVDPAAEVAMVTVPCEDSGVRFDDVARLRYRLMARLEDATGAVLGDVDEELDLRKGLDAQLPTFFVRTLDRNFRVAWTFDMGASCEALSATRVQLQATPASGAGLPFFFSAPCDAPALVGGIGGMGTYTLTARAYATDAFVAASPRSPPFTIAPGAIVDLGALTLSPCDNPCQQPGLE